MSILNRRKYIDFIYGEVYNEDFTDYELAPNIDVDELFVTVNDLVAEHVTGMGSLQLASHLPTEVYVPSEAMIADAERAKEEIDRLRRELEEAERRFRAALINKGPFCHDDFDDNYDSNDDDDNDDDGYDDDYDDDYDDNNDDDYDGDYDDCDYDGDHDDNDDDDDY